MKYRYYYCIRYNEELVAFLRNMQIRYKVCPPYIIFNIWNTDKDYQQKMLALKKWEKFDPIAYLEPSVSELEEAKYLIIRPKKQSIEIVNEDASFSYSCRYGPIVRHEKQIGEIYISKEPSTNGNTVFWCEDSGFAQIFVSSKIRVLATQNGLTGVIFQNVNLKNRGHSENLFQMTSHSVLRHDQIIWGNGEKENICPNCGKVEYDIGSAYQLHINSSKVLEQSDLYITEDRFGGCPLYIVSQRFHRVIKKAKLDKDLTFIPVVDHPHT